ncbi:MAG: type II secretion system protein N [Pseudomonadota bacterium]
MWPWATAGALSGLLATLVLHWPAHWIAPALERASGDRIRLSDVRGTPWDGSAVLSLAAGAGSRDMRTLPGRTRWHLRPGIVATTSDAGAKLPGMKLQLDQTCCLREPLAVQLGIGSSGLGVRFGALDWQGPIALVQGLGAPWNTLGFEGRLRTSTPGLALHRTGGRLRMDGRLSLAAESVSSRIAPIDSLGSYHFDIDGQRAGRGAAQDIANDAPMRFSLATLEGPLRLTGQGVWMAGQLRFSADARADPGHEAALAHVLRLIGNRNGPITLRVLR